MPEYGWRDYLHAADRKVLVADFHLGHLREVITNRKDDEPPVDVQACFEGAVVTVMAAVDQVAQAVKSAWKLPLKTQDLVSTSFAALGARLPEVRAWYEEPIGRDLRSIRVRIVHYTYSKAAHEFGWIVEPGNGGYAGQRELIAYAASAVEYGQRLRGLLSSIEQVLVLPPESEPPPLR